MEIFQTIWTALTTENEICAMIVSVPLAFIEATLTTLIFTSILDIKATKKQKSLYIFIFSLIALISIFFIPKPYNTFLNVIACPILVLFIFDTSIFKAILSEIIPYIIFLSLGSAILLIFMGIFKLDSNSFTYIPLLKILYSLTLYTFAYTLYKLISNRNIILSFKNNFKKGNSYILLLNFILGILSIIIQVYIVSVYVDVLPVKITIFNILILLTYFSISLFSLSRTNKLEITAENLEQEKLYNKTITILYDNIRVFKHDFNNIVQSIGGYISTNNIEGLKEYHADLLTDCQKVNNLAVLNPELINNPAIYSLLTSKYHKAEELGIKINFDIFLDLQTLNIKTYDLTRILGILLDNAIEASSKCDKKEIYITIRKDNKASRQLFVIENTYLNKDVNTDRIFEKGYTSKLDKDNKNHGLGLWEVRQILKRNNNLNLFTSKDNKLFKQQLEIYF